MVHPVYRFMNAMLVSVFAHFVYEDFFTLFYRLSGFGVDSGTLAGMKLYWGITIILMVGLYYSNKFFNFIDRGSIYLAFLMFGVMILSLYQLYKDGWYETLYYWYRGGVDPHNFIWALSKFTGFYSWGLLVNRIRDK